MAQQIAQNRGAINADARLRQGKGSLKADGSTRWYAW